MYSYHKCAQTDFAQVRHLLLRSILLLLTGLIALRSHPRRRA